MRPFHASWIFWIVMVATAYFKERFYSAEFMLIFFTLFTLSAISWTILNFRLARVTQNPLFKIYTYMFILSVLSGYIAVFAKAQIGSALHWTNILITATSQGLLVGAWYDVDDVDDVDDV